ncbi:MAG TPA: MFS transporter [Phytomonospora sp.]
MGEWVTVRKGFLPVREFGTFGGAVRLLLVQQFTVNAAFYLLMPYLAAYLSGDLGLTAWAVGLILGVRNLSQQGMFVVGGLLADRFGYKRLIVFGCLLRTAGFAALGFVDSLPVLLAASAVTGFAGALFGPAARAYVVREVGDRRVEAFALFGLFFQLGMFVGPLIGLVLLAFDFRVVCTVAAVIFAGLAVLQMVALPGSGSGGAPTAAERPLAEWRRVVANRPFLLFSTAMIGAHVLMFQIYLALPLQAQRAVPGSGDSVTTTLFVASAAVAAVGQLRVTAWARARWPPRRAIVCGVALMSASFLPLLAGVTAGPGAGLAERIAAWAPLVVSTAVLALGTVMVTPFELDTVARLSDGILPATYQGLHQTLSGLGVTVGNLVVGALWEASAAVPWLPWLGLALVGGCSALAVLALSSVDQPVAR